MPFERHEIPAFLHNPRFAYLHEMLRLVKGYFFLKLITRESAVLRRPLYGEVATVITNFMCTLIHYAPQMADIETRPMSNLGKAVYIYTHARLDTFSKEGLITDGGTFSIYTILFASIFFAIVGIYVAMLLLWKWAKKEASGNPER